MSAPLDRAAFDKLVDEAGPTWLDALAQQLMAIRAGCDAALALLATHQGPATVPAVPAQPGDDEPPRFGRSRVVAGPPPGAHAP